MKTKPGHTVPTSSDPPEGSIWPTVVAFGGLTVVVLGVMLYVAQDSPEREVASRKPNRGPSATTTAPSSPAESVPDEPDPFDERQAPVTANDEPNLARHEPSSVTEDVHDSARSTSDAAPADALVTSSPPDFPIPSLEPDGLEPAAPDPIPPKPPEVAPSVRTKPEAQAADEPSEPPAVETVIPDKATVTAKTKELRQTFKAEYATKDPVARMAFARRLAQDAEAHADDRATAWVLAVEARDQSIQAGDWETFVAVGQFLSERFNVDTHDDSITAFARLPGTPDASSDWYHGLLAELRSRVESMCDRDDFERAAKYASVAKTIATRAADTSMAQEWALTIKELGTLKIQFGPYKGAKETIQSNPADAAASTKWGTYLCLIKGNFEEGLLYLMRGDDAALGALAKRDANGPRDPAEMVAIADEWWKVGERTKVFRPQAWRHAAALYRQALPAITGPTATKVQQRLDEEARATAATRGPSGMSVERQLTATPWIVRWERPMSNRGEPNVDNPEELRQEEVITFYAEGRVESRRFDRFEIRNNVIELYVSRDQREPPGGGGLPGRNRDRPRHGRAILVGDELRIIFGTIDRMDNPRNRGIGTRQPVE
jgi:hypothetical protein